MGSRIWVAASWVVVSLVLPGCGAGSSGTDAQSTPSGTDAQSAPSSSATSAASAAPAGAAPDLGTCWRVPVDVNGDVHPSDWFDDSPKVPCTDPHTTETTHVLRLSKPTIAEVKRRFGECWDHVRVYLGVDPASWIPWGYAAFLPSREQIAHGASWMRCDAIFPATWDFARLRTIRDPAAGIANHPPTYLWACLGEDPKQAKQQFVPCDRRHQYEETGTLATLDNLKQYPSARELASAARQQCSYVYRGPDAHVALTAAWDPPSDRPPSPARASSSTRTANDCRPCRSTIRAEALGDILDRLAGISPHAAVRACSADEWSARAPVRPPSGDARRHRTPACLTGPRLPRRSGVGKRRRNMSSDASKATPRTSLANPSHSQAISASMPWGARNRPPPHAAVRSRPHGGQRKQADLPRDLREAYLAGVMALVRVVRVLVLLLLAVFTVSLVIGLGTSGTGVIEKVVLLALIAGCVFLAAKVSELATRVQARLQGH